MIYIPNAPCMVYSPAIGEIMATWTGGNGLVNIPVPWSMWVLRTRIPWHGPVHYSGQFTMKFPETEAKGLCWGGRFKCKSRKIQEEIQNTPQKELTEGLNWCCVQWPLKIVRTPSHPLNPHELKICDDSKVLHGQLCKIPPPVLLPFRTWPDQIVKTTTTQQFRVCYTAWWLNQPIWKICSSKWESSPNGGENKKWLKPPPSIPSKERENISQLGKRRFLIDSKGTCFDGICDRSQEGMFMSPQNIKSLKHVKKRTIIPGPAMFGSPWKGMPYMLLLQGVNSPSL